MKHYELRDMIASFVQALNEHMPDDAEPTSLSIRLSAKGVYVRIATVKSAYIPTSDQE